MVYKLIFFAIFITCLGQSCHESPKQAKNGGDKGDSVLVHESPKMDSTPSVSCPSILQPHNTYDLQKIYSDTMTFANDLLMFVTRDSALSVYHQKDNNCSLLLKIPIDSTDLYSYRDGSPLFLNDIDGDNQKEIFVTVEKNGGHSKFRVYRLVKNNGQINLKKIRRFEELMNPEYDKTTGMVRAHWYDRNDYESDEYYKISKDDELVFVKGMERKNGQEQKFETKKGW